MATIIATPSRPATAAGGLAEQAGARDPRIRAFADPLLGGGPSSGSLDASPEAPEAAKASAQALVHAATRAHHAA